MRVGTGTETVTGAIAKTVCLMLTLYFLESFFEAFDSQPEI